MQESKMPDFKDQKERDRFMADTGNCDSYGDTLEALQQIDKLLHRHNLEVHLIDNGSSDYIFKIDKLRKHNPP